MPSKTKGEILVFNFLNIPTFYLTSILENKRKKIEDMKEKKRQEDGKFKVYKERKEGEIQDLKNELEMKKNHRRQLEEEIKDIEEQK